jgi:hypothetical protein
MDERTPVYESIPAELEETRDEGITAELEDTHKSIPV